jgi:hypothetical protein
LIIFAISWSAGLLRAPGQFCPEGCLLVDDGVPVPPAGDQARVMQGGEVLGHCARGEAVPPRQGVGGRWLGK